MDVDVLDRDFLLTFTAIPLESLDLHRESAEQLHREIPVAVLLGMADTALGCITQIWIDIYPADTDQPISLDRRQKTLAGS
jgi:hypothetical protein